ncbi:MAG: hypothetical protein M1820_002971 [Bogoriella megaspora]|nr:MAG: hypothetical protein M1820_002971 [Bogoriella megaspora]
MASSSRTVMTAKAPTDLQHRLMPITCLETFSCGHYTQRRTSRTNHDLRCLPGNKLFPIDQVTLHSAPCGLSECTDADDRKLIRALQLMINHAFDVLTLLESDHEDLGRRFFTIRPGIWDSVSRRAENDVVDIVYFLKRGFQANQFPTGPHYQSESQTQLKIAEQYLFAARAAKKQGPPEMISLLNEGRRTMCEIIGDLITFDRGLDFVEKIQEMEEFMGIVLPESDEMINNHLNQALRWIGNIPAACHAADSGTMSGVASLRTLLQPDGPVELLSDAWSSDYPFLQGDAGQVFYGRVYDEPILHWIPNTVPLAALPRNMLRFGDTHHLPVDFGVNIDQIWNPTVTPLYTGPPPTDPTAENPTLHPQLTGVPGGRPSTTANGVRATSRANQGTNTANASSPPTQAGAPNPQGRAARRLSERYVPYPNAIDADSNRIDPTTPVLRSGMSGIFDTTTRRNIPAAEPFEELQPLVEVEEDNNPHQAANEADGMEEGGVPQMRILDPGLPGMNPSVGQRRMSYGLYLHTVGTQAHADAPWVQYEFSGDLDMEDNSLQTDGLPRGMR